MTVAAEPTLADVLDAVHDLRSDMNERFSLQGERISLLGDQIGSFDGRLTSLSERASSLSERLLSVSDKMDIGVAAVRGAIEDLRRGEEPGDV